MRVKLVCKGQFSSCPKADLVIRARGKVRGTRNALLAKGRGLSAAPGKTRSFSLKLTKAARKIFKDAKTRKRGKLTIRKGAKSVRASVVINGRKAGTTTVRRAGKVR